MLTAPSPFSFVLFGASGHLARIKLYPALYVLFLKKRLPEQFSIVGYARTSMTDAEFRELVGKAVQADLLEVNAKLLQEFLGHVFYQQGQYDKVDDFKALTKRLETLEKGWADPVRLAYLSIPPSVFQAVLDNLCAGGVHAGQFRCIVEKPVGHDLPSADSTIRSLTNCFTEPEIYLLDHYLGKEAVRNVYYLRLANPMLERVLKNTIIHHVEVVAAESDGLEGRAGFFEPTGTFRDFVQSHLLMMTSLLTMRLREDDSAIPETRLDALQQLYLPPASNLNEIVTQGQYGPGTVNGKQVVGYLQEEGVAPDSRTNTFAALKLLSRTPRWQGVPFYLKTGKRLARKETRISIVFQMPRAIGTGMANNRLDIILQGEAGMRIHLQTKLGGTSPSFRPLILNDPLVCVGDCLPEHGILILEAIHGIKHWFLTFAEVSSAWRLIDPVQSHLDRPDTPLPTYESGSLGPAESNDWMGRDGLDWLT